MFVVRVLTVVVASAVAFAVPAAADEQEYLEPLQEQFVYLSADRLLSEGAKVCQVTASGLTAADAVMMVRRDLGVSVGVAGEVVSAAIAKLCASPGQAEAPPLPPSF